MATTQLANLVVPEIYTMYGSVGSLANNVMVTSNIAYTSSELTMAMASGGDSIKVPYFTGLVYAEPNGASDDPSVLSTARNISAKKDIAFKQPCHQSWSVMELAVDWSGADPAQDIFSKVEDYWAEDLQHRYVNTAQGLINLSLAGDGDMVNDISAGDGVAAAATNLVSSNAVITTALTSGDKLGVYTATAMHSTVYGNLLRQDEIDFIQPSDGSLSLPYYKQMRVFLDDTMYTESYGDAGFEKIKYTTLLFGQNAFAIASGGSLLSTEVERIPSAGNGAGEERLHSRREWMVHPSGYTFIGANIVGNCPTLDELSTGSNWVRNLDRKYIKIAGLITNG